MPETTAADIPWTSRPLARFSPAPPIRPLTDLEILVTQHSAEWVAHWLYDLLEEVRQLRELLDASQSLTIEARLQVERYRLRVAALTGEIRQLLGVEPDGR